MEIQEDTQVKTLMLKLTMLRNRKSSTNYVITGGFRHAEYMDTYTIL